MIAIGFFQHQFESFFIKILFNVSVDFPQVIDIDVVFVGSVVFFENRCNLFLVFIQVWFASHGLHKLIETDASCLFQIKLRNYFIDRLFVRIESVLS